MESLIKNLYLILCSLSFILAQELVEKTTGFLVWSPDKQDYGVKVKIDYELEYAHFLNKAFIKQKAKASIIGENFYKNNLVYPKKDNESIYWNNIQVNEITLELELYDGINHLKTVRIYNLQSEAISFPVEWGEVFGLDADDEKELFVKGYKIESVKIISIQFSGEENLRNAYAIVKEEIVNPKAIFPTVSKAEETTANRNKVDTDYSDEKKDRAIVFSKKEKKDLVDEKSFFEDWDFFKHNQNTINPYYKFSYAKLKDFSLLSIAMNYNYYFTTLKENQSRTYSIGIDLNLNYLKATGMRDKNLEGSGFGLAFTLIAPLPRFEEDFYLTAGVGIKDLSDPDFNDYREVYFGLYTSKFAFADIGLSIFRAENSYQYRFNYYSDIRSDYFDKLGLRLEIVL